MTGDMFKVNGYSLAALEGLRNCGLAGVRQAGRETLKEANEMGDCITSGSGCASNVLSLCIMYFIYMYTMYTIKLSCFSRQLT